MFGIGKKIADGIRNKARKAVTRDKLEAIIAASILIAAKGGISSAEIDQLRVSIAGNKDLSAFPVQEVSQVINQFAEQITNSPRSGKMALKKEILEGASSREDAEVILLTALDVADQGGLDDDEIAAAREIAGWIDLNPADYDL